MWPGFFFLVLLMVRNVMGGHELLSCHPVRHYEAEVVNPLVMMVVIVRTIMVQI